MFKYEIQYNYLLVCVLCYIVFYLIMNTLAQIHKGGLFPGADPGFLFRGGGGGGAKDFVSAGTLRAWKSKSLSAGVQGPLKGPGSSGVYLCSHAIWALFLSLLIQTGI